MQFANVATTCKRIIQLRNIRFAADSEPLVWCCLVDALMDHLEWPAEQWEPNPMDPHGLKGRLRGEFQEIRGHLVLYTDAEKKQKTIVEFNVGTKDKNWHVTVGNTRINVSLDQLESQVPADFLDKASKTIVDAVIETARHAPLI